MPRGNDWKIHAESQASDARHPDVRSPQDMPGCLKQALRYAYIESVLAERDATAPPASMAGETGLASVDWDFVRSMLGLLFLLLGVVGIVAQIVLAEYHVLPEASWLWAVSAIIGTLGLASVSCDLIRMFVWQTMESGCE